jgi:biopolymer transport protein ExbD
MSVRIKKSSVVGLLSMTPLIDVLFMLLIFFLVATKFADEDFELDVVLPAATEAQPLTVQPQIVIINIDAEGRYMVHDKFLDIDELSLLLQQTVANNPVNQTVHIRADKKVPVDYPVQAINACMKAGIYDHRLMTEGQ